MKISILFCMFVMLIVQSDASTNYSHLKTNSHLSRFLPSSDLNISTRIGGCDFIEMARYNHYPNVSHLQKDFPDIVFKEIDDYNGRYMCSNNAHVFSTISGKFLKLMTDKDGYLYVNLYKEKGGKYKSVKVHRIVALIFVPNPENKPQINHKNGIKSDNRPDNFEWCTTQENTTHAIRTGLTQVLRGEDSHKAKLNSSQVIEIRKLLANGMYQKQIAIIYNVGQSAIWRINAGNTWKHLL